MIKTAGKTEYRRDVVLAFFLILCLFLSGCAGNSRNAQTPSGSGTVLYYLNSDSTTIVSSPYTPPDGKSLADMTSDELIGDMLTQLAKTPESVEEIPPIQGFSVNSWSLSDGQMTIDFSDEYKQQERIREILVRAAIVNTLSQLTVVSTVTFTVGGSPLTDASGQEVGAMSDDRFIFNSGNEIQNYERVRLHLYFANKNGDGLVDTYRNVVYNSNVSMERLVVEQVIKGPNSDVVYATINKDTKVLSVTTRDGVCYVNVDSAFMNDPYNVTPQVAIYSIVNSLTELPAVRQVQISIDGNTSGSFMDSIPLNQVFEKNSSLVGVISAPSSS